MSCLSDARIAAAASGDDAAASEHAAECIRCRRLLAEAETTRAQVKLVPVLELRVSRRASLRAEILAARDVASARRMRRPWAAALATVAALAVAAALMVFVRREPQSVVMPLPAVPAVEPARVAEPTRIVAPIESAGSAAPIADGLVAGEGHFERDGDSVQLTDGSITVDSQGRRSTQIVLRGTRIKVDGARVKVTASRGNLVQVVVFAGSVEVERGGHVQVIEGGEMWRPAAKEPALPKSPAARSPAVDAFHRGWRAFQVASYADAIVAFDAATDPSVAEDASYWAAIAAARSGDIADARRRLRLFVETYPASPHADAAREELAKPN